MKKLILLVCVSILIVACMKNTDEDVSTATEQEFQNMYLNALLNTKVQTNYQVIDSKLINVDLPVTSYFELQIDEKDGKQGIYEYTEPDSSDSDKNYYGTIELWHNDEYLYAIFPESKQSFPRNFYAYEQVKKMIEDAMTLNADDYPVIKGKIELEKHSGRSFFKFDLEEQYIKNSLMYIVNRAILKEMTLVGSMEIVIENNYLVEKTIVIRDKNSPNKDKTLFERTQKWSDFNQVEIKYPEGYLNYEEGNSGGWDSPVYTVQNKLVSEYGYEINQENEEVYSFDWANEIYTFNFDDAIFSLIAEENTTNYDWVTGIVSTENKGCTYIVATSENKNCNGEQLKQAIHTYKIFSQEVYHSGVSEQFLREWYLSGN